MTRRELLGGALIGSGFLVAGLTNEVFKRQTEKINPKIEQKARIVAERDSLTSELVEINLNEDLFIKSIQQRIVGIDGEAENLDSSISNGNDTALAVAMLGAVFGGAPIIVGASLIASEHLPTINEPRADSSSTPAIF